MKSYCIKKYGAPLERVERDTPTPEGDEILLDVAGCGVCHSDVHLWDGYFNLGGERKSDLSGIHRLPFTLGHEIAGTVKALGSTASKVKVGSNVVVYPWIGCGGCSICQSGQEQLCSNPRNLGINRAGGYSTHVIVPHGRYLLDIGDLAAELAATYACSGLTAYGAIKKLKSQVKSEYLVIIGAGGVGLAAVKIVKAMMQTRTIVIDINPLKLQAALAAGAEHVIDFNNSDARKQLYKLTGGVRALLDFVGSDDTVNFAFGALGTGGHLVIVGLFGGAATLPTPMFPLKNLTLMGSYVGSLEEMKELMSMVRAGKIDPLPVLKRPLDQADDTLRDLEKGNIVGRVVLMP